MNPLYGVIEVTTCGPIAGSMASSPLIAVSIYLVAAVAVVPFPEQTVAIAPPIHHNNSWSLLLKSHITM
ncbi:uncharacterized protein BO87DRAFT_138194 [Aspergillus neoniger CBS 115656]|uniref:Uncharacterized protein n=1 Tax=Aspergillus neoniger (strain CBS 115656) TaxID=1448310 RepID=A0A318YAK8_ASPNB|nr:hypothetical protein BO87DRAFT_138194 [Aspergillus neoniger CBS 115656]PYH31054.1 hypothetical protein BO87DRAFT_138194 [Aspergillus neoniger CBS 115656]